MRTVLAGRVPTARDVYRLFSILSGARPLSKVVRGPRHRVRSSSGAAR